MRRVLLVGKGPPERGGIPAFLGLLQDGLGDGYEVGLLNLTRSAATPQGGRFTWHNLTRTLGDAPAVWRAAREVDLVHVHSALSSPVTIIRAGLLCLAARLGGAAVVLHGHGGRIQLLLTTRWTQLLTALALRPAHRVVAVSEGARAALATAVPAQRLVLIDNGVDTDRFAPGGDRDGQSTPVILYVGILTPRKGVIDLLEASRLLRADGVDHRLVLLGGMPDEGPEAQARVRDADNGTAEFAGTVTPGQMPERYHEADLLCLPSWWEAMPLSVLEAMASGLPVVATDVGDVARVVEDGVTGRVVPARDPAALAVALAPLLGSAELRGRMGAAGRERVEQRFSAQSTCAAVTEVYAAAATASGARRLTDRGARQG